MEETMHGMKASSKQRKLKKARRCSHTTKYGGFCCSCRLSISSPEETEADYSEKPDYLSAIVHAMVQKRLEKLIRETRRQREIKAKEEDMTNFMVCRDSRFMRMALAVDKVSFDLREDLKKSMIEMIMANEMEQPNELRRLLECYLSLNSEGCAGFILEVFHEVCSLIFMDSSSTMVGLV